MADATVPRQRPDDALAQSAERESHAPTVAVRDGRRWPFYVLWSAFALILVLFISLGSVRVGAGNWIGRRMSVPRIWDLFLDFLIDQGASRAVVAIVVAAAIIAIAGGVGLVWLAFGVRDDPSSPGESPGP